MIKKQITMTNVTLLLGLVVGLIFAVVPADTTHALNQKEKKACYERWAGRSTGTAGNGQTYSPKNFEKSNCYIEKGGSCSIARYNDGSSLYCERKDGKYDNSENNNTWNKTKGGFSSPPQGDGAPNTSGGDDKKDGGDGNSCEDIRKMTSIIRPTCSGDGVEGNAIFGLLLLVVRILTAGVAIVAVGGIIYGGILYATAGDSSEQVKKAVGVIINVVIGIVAFAAMYALSEWLIPGGIFS